jgi:hypothetical protein
LDSRKVEAIARETGFCKRRRKLSSIQFIQTLLFRSFAGGKQSLNDHVVQLSCNEDTVFTKQSLDERFTKSSVDFVKKVLLDHLHSGNKLKELPFLDSFSPVLYRIRRSLNYLIHINLPIPDIIKLVQAFSWCRISNIIRLAILAYTLKHTTTLEKQRILNG